MSSLNSHAPSSEAGSESGFELDLDRVRAGDEDAAGKLIGRLHPLVVKISRAHLPRRMAVEDLVQEVFVRVFDRLPRYESREGIPFEHWVARLAVRTCLDALRTERRRPEVHLGDLPDGEAAWLDYLVCDEAERPLSDAGDARAIVERLLRELSPDDRLVISLLDLEERSIAQVSELTGWSQVGVRVRAFRARKRLRKAAESAREKGML